MFLSTVSSNGDEGMTACFLFTVSSYGDKGMKACFFLQNGMHAAAAVPNSQAAISSGNTPRGGGMLASELSPNILQMLSDRLSEHPP
jgi:hypothetical protein